MQPPNLGQPAEENRLKGPNKLDNAGGPWAAEYMHEWLPQRWEHIVHATPEEPKEATGNESYSSHATTRRQDDDPGASDTTCRLLPVCRKLGDSVAPPGIIELGLHLESYVAIGAHDTGSLNLVRRHEPIVAHVGFQRSTGRG